MKRIVAKGDKRTPIFKVLIISILIVGVSAINLSESRAQLLLGLKSGARMSWLNYEKFDNESYEKAPSFGYSIGATAAFKVQKRFSLQLDILYSQNGKKVESANGSTLDNQAKYHFLNTPLIYRMDFIETLGDKSFKWYIGAGPNVNFWLGGKGVLKAVELLEENIESLDYKIIFEPIPANPDNEALYLPEVNRLQLGLAFSAGLILEPMQGQSFLIDFRYEWGHSYMADEEEGSFPRVVAYRDDLKAASQAFQISVAYIFDVINKGGKERKMYYQN